MTFKIGRGKVGRWISRSWKGVKLILWFGEREFISINAMRRKSASLKCRARHQFMLTLLLAEIMPKCQGAQIEDLFLQNENSWSFHFMIRNIHFFDDKCEPSGSSQIVMRMCLGFGKLNICFARTRWFLVNFPSPCRNWVRQQIKKHWYMMEITQHDKCSSGVSRLETRRGLRVWSCALYEM